MLGTRIKYRDSVGIAHRAQRATPCRIKEFNPHMPRIRLPFAINPWKRATLILLGLDDEEILLGQLEVFGELSELDGLSFA